MPRLGVVTNPEDLQKPKWVTYDAEGYADDEEKVEFLIRPQTRSSLNIIENRSKMAKKGEEDGVPMRGDKKSERFTRELAKFLLADWRNVCDSVTGEELECNDHNKILLFESIEIALWIIDEAKKLASVRMESEVKNSERSSAGTLPELN